MGVLMVEVGNKAEKVMIMPPFGAKLFLQMHNIHAVKCS